ncbi:hypothetical protein D7V06_16025 [Salmonella enterica]|nr:hypothetical protein [Salmonella enterica]
MIILMTFQIKEGIAVSDIEIILHLSKTIQLIVLIKKRSLINFFNRPHAGIQPPPVKTHNKHFANTFKTHCKHIANKKGLQMCHSALY